MTVRASQVDVLSAVSNVLAFAVMRVGILLRTIRLRMLVCMVHFASSFACTIAGAGVGTEKIGKGRILGG